MAKIINMAFEVSDEITSEKLHELLCIVCHGALKIEELTAMEQISENVIDVKEIISIIGD